MSTGYEELRQQIEDLRKLLEEERAARAQLQKQLSQTQELVQKEAIKRQKLTNWIQQNIGPNLENIKQLIEEKQGPVVPPPAAIPIKISKLKIPEQPASPNKPELPTRKGSTPRLGVQKSAPVSQSSSPGIDFKERVSPRSSTAVAEKAPTEEVVPSQFPARYSTENAILDKYEQHVFTQPLVVEPGTDAMGKANRPGRLNHFLVTRKQAQIVYQNPRLPDTAVKFAEAGGKLILVPLDPDDVEKDQFAFGIQATDRCYCVCPNGLFLAQFAHLIVAGIKRALGNRDKLIQPHGALNGYDPYPNSDYALHSAPPDYMDLFRKTFGQDMAYRMGQDTLPPGSLTRAAGEEPQKVAKIKETLVDYFDLFYFKHNPNRTERTIFLCFGVATPITISRLLQINGQKPGSLNGIVMVSFPFTFPYSEELTRQNLFDKYKHLATLIQPSNVK